MGRRSWGGGKAGGGGASQASPRAWDKAFLLLPPVEDIHRDGTEHGPLLKTLRPSSSPGSPSPMAPDLASALGPGCSLPLEPSI